LWSPPRLLLKGLFAQLPSRLDAKGPYPCLYDLRKGKSAPLAATKRWVVALTNSWHNAHKKLLWCTERRDPDIDFWITSSDVVIIVQKLIPRAWTRYRWETRPTRRP
jgi:hypothetical protein